MFEDGRSKSIIFVSHCILNQNAKMDGTAAYPGPIREFISSVAASDVGIVQMSCPEFVCLGLARGNTGEQELTIVQENTRIRRLMEVGPAIDKVNGLVADVVSQVSDYQKYGFKICGIVGVNRSPTCGVDTTSDHNQEVEGEGVFIKMLREEMERKSLHVKMVGIKAFELHDIKTKLMNILATDA